MYVRKHISYTRLQKTACYLFDLFEEIRVYDLVKQALLRKLNPALKWISSIDIHPKGIPVSYCCIYAYAFVQATIYW